MFAVHSIINFLYVLKNQNSNKFYLTMYVYCMCVFVYFDLKIIASPDWTK